MYLELEGNTGLLIAKLWLEDSSQDWRKARLEDSPPESPLNQGMRLNMVNHRWIDTVWLII